MSNLRGSPQALAVDPSHSGTVYVVGSDPSPNGSGPALFKTTDRGDTWVRLDTPFFPEGESFSGVNDLAIDPSTGDIYVAYSKCGDKWGLYKGTNGGNAWTALRNGIPYGSNAGEVLVDPETPSTVYATVCSSYGNGLYKSTDGGASWVRASQQLTEHCFDSLAMSSTNSQRLYGGYNYYGVYHSEDGGETWEPMNTGWESLLETMWIQELVIAPGAGEHQEIIYAGTPCRGVWQYTRDVALFQGNYSGTK